MRYWAVTISADQYAAERLYYEDALVVKAESLRAGDPVALVGGTDPPVVFGLGEVTRVDGGTAEIAYTRRFFDDPQPAADMGLTDEEGTCEIPAPLLLALAGDAPVSTSPRRWLVSVDLPIEADTAADAVRQFWSYVKDLGPRELPAFVSPADDELAMQAYVLGAEANQDPEEDE